eukprot:3295833-Rhodomonas_salina.1
MSERSGGRPPLLAYRASFSFLYGDWYRHTIRQYRTRAGRQVPPYDKPVQCDRMRYAWGNWDLDVVRELAGAIEHGARVIGTVLVLLLGRKLLLTKTMQGVC